MAPPLGCHMAARVDRGHHTLTWPIKVIFTRPGRNHMAARARRRRCMAARVDRGRHTLTWPVKVITRPGRNHMAARARRRRCTAALALRRVALALKKLTAGPALALKRCMAGVVLVRKSLMAGVALTRRRQTWHHTHKRSLTRKRSLTVNLRNMASTRVPRDRPPFQLLPAARPPAARQARLTASGPRAAT
jgi:hypothetical protein